MANALKEKRMRMLASLNILKPFTIQYAVTQQTAIKAQIIMKKTITKNVLKSVSVFRG